MYIWFDTLRYESICWVLNVQIWNPANNTTTMNDVSSFKIKKIYCIYYLLIYLFIIVPKTKKKLSDRN